MDIGFTDEAFSVQRWALVPKMGVGPTDGALASTDGRWDHRRGTCVHRGALVRQMSLGPTDETSASILRRWAHTWALG